MLIEPRCKADKYPKVFDVTKDLSEKGKDHTYTRNCVRDFVENNGREYGLRNPIRSIRLKYLTPHYIVTLSNNKVYVFVMHQKAN
ncbi:MAG TPA: hypothetical protein VEA37_03280 [Flavobacterium sp.]|nr:hypothetical protein [Flavobacterium sp.]